MDEQSNQVVNQEAPTTPEPSQPVIEEAAGEAIKPGDKTDPNLLLKSLREEREKRRELEEEVKSLKSSAQSETEVFSDEGKALSSELGAVKSELSEVKTELAKKDILIAHPVLKEKWEEFEEFRTNPDNKGMNLRTAAKAYLVENGLLDATRKGLENPTGGTRVPPTSGITADDVKKLRDTNWKEYLRRLKLGEFRDIK